MATSGTNPPKYRVTTFKAIYSGRALTVRCVVEPTDPSWTISLLLVRADDPKTGTIYLNPCAISSAGTPPPAGTGLTVSDSTVLFAPTPSTSRVRVGYFGFVTDPQGVSYDFDGMRIFNVSPS